MDLELKMCGKSDLRDTAIDEEFNSRDVTRLASYPSMPNAKKQLRSIA
jgi:hypothetical protein